MQTSTAASSETTRNTGTAAAALDTPPLRIPQEFIHLAADCATVVEPGSPDHVATWDSRSGCIHALPYLLGGEYDTQKAMKLAAENYRLGDFTDWRLPERFEKESILDLTKHDPCVDSRSFPGTRSGYEWTATPVPGNSVCAFVVGFDFGVVYFNLVGYNGFRARAVRGPVPRPGQ